MPETSERQPIRVPDRPDDRVLADHAVGVGAAGAQAASLPATQVRPRRRGVVLRQRSPRAALYLKAIPA